MSDLETNLLVEEHPYDNIVCSGATQVLYRLPIKNNFKGRVCKTNFPLYTGKYFQVSYCYYDRRIFKMVFVCGKRKAIKTCKTLKDCCFAPALFIVAPEMGCKMHVMLNQDATEFVKLINLKDHY